MLDGRVKHADSVGNQGVIEAGDVQWMTAGRGIIHSEMPERADGRLRGFQLWVNLPGKLKMHAPALPGRARCPHRFGGARRCDGARDCRRKRSGHRAPPAR